MQHLLLVQLFMETKRVRCKEKDSDSMGNMFGILKLLYMQSDSKGEHFTDKLQTKKGK